MHPLRRLHGPSIRFWIAWALGILLMLLPVAEAWATPPSTLDGRLRQILHQAAQSKPRRSAPTAAPSIRCHLRARDVAAVRARITELGGRVGTVAGDVLTATVPVESLVALANDPSVVRVEAGRPVRPKLDRVAAAVNLRPVQSGTAPFAFAYRGAGVVVGVVDLSLDLSHPAFRSGGHSRVVALWDQTGSQSPPPGFDYGRFCARDAIDSGACRFSVQSEHGTHVTGVAAGSQVSGSPYVGIAPEADIVFVHLADPVDQTLSFDEWLSASVCDGVAFVFQVAEELGQPAVVNLSLGTHTGPHDGSSLASACLDNLVGPGRVIVAAAGNEGEPWIHSQLDLPVYVHAGGDAGAAGQRVDFVPGDYVSEGEIVDVWFDEGGPAATLQVGVELADGSRIVTDPVALGDPVREDVLVVPGASLGPVLISTDSTPAGAKNFQVTVGDEDGDFAETAQRWFFILTAAGHFDAFLDVNGGGGFIETASGVRVDTRMSIGYPAVARGVIAVGSSVSRIEWTDVSGDLYETFDYLTGDSLVLGQLSTFSSRGPTRNPALTGIKPDVVAPGEMVASALANVRGLDVPASTIVLPAPAGYFVGAGTSQSAPVVAGIVALMLERDPTLDPDRVRALLREAATAPVGVELPSDEWGFGRVNAAGAVALTPDVSAKEMPPDRVGKGGCGCHVPRAGGVPGPDSWLPMLALALLRWRRRRGGT